MGNLLTPGLLAAAFMAAANVALGGGAISWDVFAAAATAFLLALDTGDSRVADGGPAGHSIGGALAITYLVGVLAYASTVLLGVPRRDALMLVLAVGAGAGARLAAELAAGRAVFTFPMVLDPADWLEERGPGRLWGGWGRISAGAGRLGDLHMNAISVGLLLACIWLSGR